MCGGRCFVVSFSWGFSLFVVDEHVQVGSAALEDELVPVLDEPVLDERVLSLVLVLEDIMGLVNS